MAKRIDKETWKEFIEKFSSYEGTVTQYFIENNLSKSQFYYHKRRFETPQTIFYNSMASNDLIEHTLTLKYQHAMPLYRQEKYFDMMGATLSRQTLCNWTMSAADALVPIYKHMKKELLNRNYIQADETTLKVIDDNGKDYKSKKYMWLYMSNTDFKPVILYDYQSTRSSSCPQNFLGDFKGFLQTDGYTGYNLLLMLQDYIV